MAVVAVAVAVALLLKIRQRERVENLHAEVIEQALTRSRRLTQVAVEGWLREAPTVVINPDDEPYADWWRSRVRWRPGVVIEVEGYRGRHAKCAA
ncbi:hypothetical protein [Longimycelium tulufanense]|nr:hypothetical protein [Longimycelium tulufanense]